MESDIDSAELREEFKQMHKVNDTAMLPIIWYGCGKHGRTLCKEYVGPPRTTAGGSTAGEAISRLSFSVAHDTCQMSGFQSPGCCNAVGQLQQQFGCCTAAVARMLNSTWIHAAAGTCRIPLELCSSVTRERVWVQLQGVWWAKVEASVGWEAAIFPAVAADVAGSLAIGPEYVRVVGYQSDGSFELEIWAESDDKVQPLVRVLRSLLVHNFMVLQSTEALLRAQLAMKLTHDLRMECVEGDLECESMAITPADAAARPLASLAQLCISTAIAMALFRT
jgi:hypothetical protein